jgi:hypothetical protein
MSGHGSLGPPAPERKARRDVSGRQVPAKTRQGVHGSVSKRYSIGWKPEWDNPDVSSAFLPKVRASKISLSSSWLRKAQERLMSVERTSRIVSAWRHAHTFESRQIPRSDEWRAFATEVSLAKSAGPKSTTRLIVYADRTAVITMSVGGLVNCCACSHKRPRCLHCIRLSGAPAFAWPKRVGSGAAG